MKDILFTYASPISVSLEVLYGLALFVFGIDGFIKKLPIPAPAPRAKDFVIALDKTGYMMPLIKALEILCGFMLMFRIFPFVALILISPIILNIFLFQLFLNEKRSKIGWILLLIHLVCFSFYHQSILNLAI
jgi:hypothetical protein